MREHIVLLTHFYVVKRFFSLKKVKSDMSILVKYHFLWLDWSVNLNFKNTEILLVDARRSLGWIKKKYCTHKKMKQI